MAYALRSRLNTAVRDISRSCEIFTRHTSKVDPQCRRCFASHENVDDEENPRPTKYTTSKANYMSAQSARKETTRDEAPFSQTVSLLISSIVFLGYFGYFREANDLDDMIHHDISETVPGLKEVQDKLQTRAGREASKRSIQ